MQLSSLHAYAVSASYEYCKMILVIHANRILIGYVNQHSSCLANRSKAVSLLVRTGWWIKLYISSRFEEGIDWFRDKMHKKTHLRSSWSQISNEML